MFVMTVTQECDLAVAYFDAGGNPAKVDGVPVWSVSDDTLVVLSVASDGMSAVAAAAGTAGDCQVSVSADADLGQGTRSLVGLLDMQIVPAEAVVAQISAGPPREITPVVQPVSSP